MKTTIFNTSFFVLFFMPFIVNGQSIIVSGYVINEKNGDHLESVSIYESGTKIGTITDKNGFYKLMLPVGELKLSAKINGYQGFLNKMTIKNDTVFSIRLKPVNEKESVSKEDEKVQAIKDTGKNLNSKKKLFKF